MWDFLRYKIEKGLRAVEYTVESSIFCKQCNLSCARPGSLKVHNVFYTIKHSGEKPYACTQCSYSCTLHTSWRPQNILARPFRREAFRLHTVLLLLHNSLSPQDSQPDTFMRKAVSCTQCKCACASAGNLKRHMLTHSGAKPVLPHLQGNIEIGRHKDRNAEVGNTKHRIYWN